IVSRARIAPSWIRTANVLPKSSSLKPKKCSSNSRCPVDDTGMYSVRPSTMPRPAALKISTNIDRNSVVNRQNPGMNKDRETPSSRPACGPTRPAGQETVTSRLSLGSRPTHQHGSGSRCLYCVKADRRISHSLTRRKRGGFHFSPRLWGSRERGRELPGFERIEDFYTLPFVDI